MNYLDGVKQIKQIEEEYDVMSIRYKDISAWSFLRLHILDKITDNREFKPSGSIILLVLKSLFSYNIFQIFKRFDFWVFTNCERRKCIGDKMVQRVSGVFSDQRFDYLMIEKPSVSKGHYKRSEIKERNIISEAWLLLISRLLMFVSKPFPIKIENEDIIKAIIKDKGIDFDYRHYLKLLNAQRLAVRFMITITKKPKMIFMESPYDTMGYMWAFHQAGVRILVLQHGVLNNNHYAYNALSYEKEMNPDCLCVFGEEEYNYFKIQKPQYAPMVKMTGLYMLELADSFFNVDPFVGYRKKYDLIIVVAGQPNVEHELSLFVDEIALSRKDVLFIYIPRSNDANISFKAENVVLKYDVNIYEYLKWADVHMTISSTSCLEAHYYHTPTIFWNYYNVSCEYYGHILCEENGAMYIEYPQQFNSALTTLLNMQIKWKELFAHHHAERINQLINETLGVENI